MPAQSIWRSRAKKGCCLRLYNGKSGDFESIGQELELITLDLELFTLNAP
ncbi:hypothetical protein JYQ62_05865 [Nostoc sp. UHCC 0702]|nr:hypothetical protein JYQ62_05865 [Nostoc sp. UHCC 0702]